MLQDKPRTINNNNNNELYLHGHKRDLQHCKSILIITKSKQPQRKRKCRRPMKKWKWSMLKELKRVGHSWNRAKSLTMKTMSPPPLREGEIKGNDDECNLVGKGNTFVTVIFSISCMFVRFNLEGNHPRGLTRCCFQLLQLQPWEDHQLYYQFNNSQMLTM